MDLRFGEMVDEIGRPIRESLRRGEHEEVEGGNARWKHKTRCVWQRMNKLIERVGRVWDETEKEQFFSYIKTDLERQCCLLILGESYVKKDLERQFRLMLEEFS